MSNFPFTPEKVEKVANDFCRDCDACCWVVSNPSVFDGITSDKWEDRLCFNGKSGALNWTISNGGTFSLGPDGSTRECSGQCVGFWQNGNFDGGYSTRWITFYGCNSGFKCPVMTPPPEPTEDQWTVRSGNTKYGDFIYYPCILEE